MTITHDALDFTVQVPLPPNMGPPWTRTPLASDIWWPSIDTFSLHNPLLVVLLKHMRVVCTLLAFLLLDIPLEE